MIDLNKLQAIPYIGTKPGEDEIIALQNRHRMNMSILKNVDVEEIDPVKLQKMIDILKDEFECQSCERKDNKLESLRDEIYGFSLYLHDVISYASMYLEGEALTKFEEKVSKLRKHSLNQHKEFDMDF